MIKKLRLKFVLINMSIVTIMLCIILGLLFYFTRANLESESLRMMQTVANQPFRLGLPNDLSEEVRLPYFVLQLGPRGELVATDGGYYDLSDDEFLNQLIDTAFSSPKQSGVIKEYHLRYYRGDAPLNPRLVVADISSELATLNHLLKTCLFIFCFGFLVFLCVSILLSKWAVKPVSLAWEQQRQFVADASHELKTPLTVIMTNAELLQSSEYNEEKRTRFAANILTMSRQMRGLVEQLLNLAQADSMEAKELKESVDFSRLVSDAILPFEPIFFEQGLQLTTEVAKGIQVFGAKAQLRQILEILLDNACKYSRKAGTTWVTLEKYKKGRCLLTVANEGTTLLPEDLKNIFKRFYRADKARSRTGSFGLGLSIAESIVTQHRGKIRAESENGVTRLYVELPCS